MIDINMTKNLHGSKGEMTLSVHKTIDQGEFVVLMGESGSGKTTLLRVLAGLEEAEGNIVVDGVSWKGISPQKREIGFVFQEYALFSNMTVEQNLLFVKKDKKLSNILLEMTELTALATKNVSSLSGGQKQRVALCRAMMSKPRLLLMDEPFSAVSIEMKLKLKQKIKQLHDTFGTTTIMVSHDVSEVYGLADSVWIMQQGKIIKNGTIEEVLKQDTHTHNAEILNLIKKEGKMQAKILIDGKVMEVQTQDDVKIGDNIEVVLRPFVKDKYP